MMRQKRLDFAAVKVDCSNHFKLVFLGTDGPINRSTNLKSQATYTSSAWLFIKLTSVMIRTKGWIRQSLRTLSFSKPHSRSTKATRMNHSQPFEEERLPWYRADQFYPVHIGETFISRYKVVGKLEYGAYSTVWLCRDMKSRNPPRTIWT